MNEEELIENMKEIALDWYSRGYDHGMRHLENPYNSIKESFEGEWLFVIKEEIDAVQKDEMEKTFEKMFIIKGEHNTGMSKLEQLEAGE